MTLAELLEWLETIEAEFGNLKITRLNLLPIHQNRVELEIGTFDMAQPRTFLKTFERRDVSPVTSEAKHP